MISNKSKCRILHLGWGDPDYRGSFPWAAVLQELLQHGSIPWGTILQEQTAPASVLHEPQFLPENLLLLRLLSMGSSSCQEPAPASSLSGLQLPSGHIHLLQCGVLYGSNCNWNMSGTAAAKAWGPTHGTQSFTNFSNVGPSHRLQFFKNCSSMGPFHGVQSYKNRLLQCGSPMGSQVLSGACSCVGSPRAAASFRHIHLLQHGVLHRLQAGKMGKALKEEHTPTNTSFGEDTDTPASPQQLAPGTWACDRHKQRTFRTCQHKGAQAISAQCGE
ncbi:hypothetical protein QYF61_005561 [Mycteria americana]|uniref:Uncharacterized protein n=1 Tax=Mycteria americana TaxID=33587 RepID=A0AAN7RKR4_MYCAM|nr:hypothetical protein QYF61_005561 [Mycteria americana]